MLAARRSFFVKDPARLGAALICVCPLLLSGITKLDASSAPRQQGYLEGGLIYALEARPTPQCHASTLVEEIGVCFFWRRVWVAIFCITEDEKGSTRDVGALQSEVKEKVG